MSDQGPENQEPKYRPDGSVPGKTVGRVIGFSCLATLIIPIVMFYGLVQSTSKLGEAPEVAPSVSALTGLAEEYKQQVKDNSDLIPSFGEFTNAVFARGLPCLESQDSPDSCLLAETKSYKTEQASKICDEVIALGKKLGATQDSTPTMSFVGSMWDLSENSRNGCIETMQSYPRSIGWAFLSPSYYLQGEASNGAPFAIQLYQEQLSPYTAGNEPANPNTDPSTLAAESYSYTILTSTNYDTPDPWETLPQYSDPNIQVAALLDTVAYYRRSNPEIPIFDPVFVNTMIKEYKRSFRFEGEAEAFVSPNGEAHYIHFKDPALEICVSIGASRAELEAPYEAGFDMGMLETGLPGKGEQLIELSGLRYKVYDDKPLNPFGYYKSGSCN